MSRPSKATYATRFANSGRDTYMHVRPLDNPLGGARRQTALYPQATHRAGPSGPRATTSPPRQVRCSDTAYAPSLFGYSRPPNGSGNPSASLAASALVDSPAYSPTYSPVRQGCALVGSDLRRTGNIIDEALDEVTPIDLLTTSSVPLDSTPMEDILIYNGASISEAQSNILHGGQSNPRRPPTPKATLVSTQKIKDLLGRMRASEALILDARKQIYALTSGIDGRMRVLEEWALKQNIVIEQQAATIAALRTTIDEHYKEQQDDFRRLQKTVSTAEQRLVESAHMSKVGDGRLAMDIAQRVGALEADLAYLKRAIHDNMHGL